MVWLSPDPWRPAHPQPLWQVVPPPILLSWLSVCPSYLSRDDQKATTSSCSCLVRICGLRSIAVPARRSYNEAQGWIPPIAPSLPPVPCPLLYLPATHCRSCGQTYYSGDFHLPCVRSLRSHSSEGGTGHPFLRLLEKESKHGPQGKAGTMPSCLAQTSWTDLSLPHLLSFPASVSV